MKQSDRVLAYIKKYGSITTLEAFRDLGVTRLSARIYELNHHDGVEFIKSIETSKNRYGERVAYARYALKESEA